MVLFFHLILTFHYKQPEYFYPVLCTTLFASCCQLLPVFTGFVHCPGENTFCHGKKPNPALN